jgi:hypothetical protein
MEHERMKELYLLWLATEEEESKMMGNSNE